MLNRLQGASRMDFYPSIRKNLNFERFFSSEGNAVKLGNFNAEFFGHHFRQQGTDFSK